MSACRDDPLSPLSQVRGQSAVLGIVLLIGIVAIGSFSIFVVAGGSIDEAQRNAEQERIEQAFVELSQNMATASVDNDSVRTMDFEAGEHGAVTKTNAGNITLEYGGETENVSLGAVEYEGDDGSIVAYQAGGVWRERGNETHMLSAPQVHYEDETLTLPIATVSGEQNLDSGTVTIAHNNTTSHESLSVENESVTMVIESEYYRGWEEYVRTQAGDMAVREVDHENNSVTVLLGYDEVENAFSSGAMYGSKNGLDDDKDHFENATRAPMPELDDVIHEMAEDARNEGEVGDEPVDINLTGKDLSSDISQPLSDGIYYIDEFENGDELNFDISGGNATLIVDGNISVSDSGGINVVNKADENTLKIYSTGEVFRVDGEVCVEACDDGGAKHLQVYGTSEMGSDLGPNSGGAFEGVIYSAADDDNGWWDHENGNGACQDAQARFQGNSFEFNGSIVAHSICAQDASLNIDYDEGLEDANIDIYPEEYSLPPQIHYLNIAEYEIDVENE
ncbi:DUF7289 family protein [Salinilacihabitans rarus]|uniref:DUF7289 family protein n=1 Tax=Salinilacihabitans rarus TaxID=2961596 RepID=UPI0020C8699F|nr:hypothetical protein [Salinilacihabitans rarus]